MQQKSAGKLDLEDENEERSKETRKHTKEETRTRHEHIQKLNCYCITLKRRPTSRTTPEWSQKGRENYSTTPIDIETSSPPQPIGTTGERPKIERNDASDNTASLPDKYTID